jgi:hypothetical protein
MASPSSASPANILFFSPGCEYSREIVGLINTNQLRTKFLMVDVSIKQYKVPDFVDRVPMILIKASNQLVIDENLPVYINTLVSASASASSAQGAGLETIAMSDMGGRGGFSFLDGAGGGGGGGGNYETIGPLAGPLGPTGPMQGPGPIRGAPGDSLPSIDTSKQARLDPRDFELFTAQRDMDLAAFKQPR